MARLVALAACLAAVAGQTVTISVSGGQTSTAPYYTFSPALPTMFEAGTTYVFTAAGIGTNHPFRVGTARGTTPAWVTGTTTGFTGTGGSLTMAIPSGYAGSNVVLYCDIHTVMTLTRLVRAIPTGASCSGNTLDQHWIQAPLSTSCTDACAAVGRACVSDTDHATTETCVNEISNLPTINRPCVTYQTSASDITPTIYDGGIGLPDTCYYYTGSNAHVECSFQFTTTWWNRICPCTPDSPPPSTPPPPSPPPPSPSPPVCPTGTQDHTWVLGDGGQSCADACADDNLSCVQGAALGQSIPCLEAIVATLPAGTCPGGVLPGTGSATLGGPFLWTGFAPGYCYTSAVPTLDCAQTVGADYQRFCACGPHSPPPPSLPPLESPPLAPPPPVQTIHQLPRHTCGGSPQAPHNNAADAHAECLSYGCTGLANLSFINSPHYMYAGQQGANTGNTTDTRSLCSASWYINDLTVLGTDPHVMAFYMHNLGNLAPGGACGNVGWNAWNGNFAAAACVGCAPHLDKCPSPPPASPPASPPISALCVDGYWPLFANLTTSDAASPVGTSHMHILNNIAYYMSDSFPGAQHNEAGDGSCPHHATLVSPASPPPLPASPPAPGIPVQEPDSALVVFGIIGGSLLGCILLVVGLVCLCAAPIAAASKKIDCADRPDPYENPKAFREWRRQCEEENNVDTAARVSLLRF